MARPKVHDEALRVRLLDTAGALLTAEGPGALSVRRLAVEVGTSTTAVYSLFGGKPGLLHALFAEAFRRFGSYLAKVTPTADPLADLRRLGEAYRASALADPHLYAVMFGSPIPGFTPDAEDWAVAERTFAPLVAAVRRAVVAGALRDEDPGLISMAMWGVVHGLVSLELGKVRPPDAAHPAAVFDAATRAHLDGWRPVPHL